MFVCVCNGITDRDLRHEVDAGARTFADLQARTGVASCCGQCADCAQAVLGEALATQAATAQAPCEREAA